MSKLAKEELKENGIYMCGVRPHRKQALIWKYDVFNRDTDWDRDFRYEDLDTIEHIPNTKGDTIQEVIDWCDKNNLDFSYSSSWAPQFQIGKQPQFIDEKKYQFCKLEQFLNHIRKPKLKEITQKELAAMGYKLK